MAGVSNRLPYRHTQRSVLMSGLAIASAVAALAGVVATGLGATRWWWVATFAFIAIVMATASRLDVTVDDEAVTASFRWGWPRRRLAVSDIAAVTAVTNSWWHGWGIRKVSRGWMYNVAGYDAVQLELGSTRMFRIGTDDQPGLVDAIDAARSA